MGFVSSCWADLDLWKPQEFEVSTPPRALCLLLPGARDTAELGQGHCLPVPGLHRESPRHLLFLTCCYLVHTHQRCIVLFIFCCICFDKFLKDFYICVHEECRLYFTFLDKSLLDFDVRVMLTS